MIKKLARSIREYKKPAILTPLFMVGEVVMEVLIPLLMANLIDFGIEMGDMGYILKMGTVLVISCLASLAFGMLSGHFAAVASSGFGKNLRSDLFAKVQGFAFSNIDKFSSASLVTRLTTDVASIQNTFAMCIRMVVRAPLMFLTSLIMAIFINPTLSLIFLAAIPILAGGIAFIMTHAHPIFKRTFKLYDKLNRVVQENLHGVRVVKAFVREDYETEKFNEVSGSIYKDFTKAEKIVSYNSPLMQFCSYACILLISWIGAQLIVASGNDQALGLTTGQLTSLFSYGMQILSSLMMVSFIFLMLVISRASGERIVEVLDETSDLASPENAKTEVKDGSVAFENVTFRYGRTAEKPVLDHINITIPSGATVGVIGGTGSSKSTLVQLIPRLYDTVEGSVKVGGVDVREYDLDALRNAVAMVLQKNELFSGTIKENLRWGNKNATDEELIHACKLAQADEFVTSFPDGYDTHIEQGGTNVSGGQKQRLCIARALLKKPKILILDDSTSAVDTKTDALIRRAFLDEIPDTTKFIIAQRISSVQDADIILVMEEGRIDGVGTHEELLNTNAIYKEVYESQQKGGGDDDFDR